MKEKIAAKNLRVQFGNVTRDHTKKIHTRTVRSIPNPDHSPLARVSLYRVLHNSILKLLGTVEETKTKIFCYITIGRKPIVRSVVILEHRHWECGDHLKWFWWHFVYRYCSNVRPPASVHDTQRCDNASLIHWNTPYLCCNWSTATRIRATRSSSDTIGLSYTELFKCPPHTKIEWGKVRRTRRSCNESTPTTHAHTSEARGVFTPHSQSSTQVSDRVHAAAAQDNTLTYN